jgi:hypothetical protein
MKKQISFDKNIEFPTMIGEISAIALDQDLKFVDEGNISGNLLLTGKYKSNDLPISGTIRSTNTLLSINPPLPLLHQHL